VEAVIECQTCGDELAITEDGISECATCAWFAATFTQVAIDFAAEQARIQDADDAWANDAARFFSPNGAR
jgi:hypothetical protein